MHEFSRKHFVSIDKLVSLHMLVMYYFWQNSLSIQRQFVFIWFSYPGISPPLQNLSYLFITPENFFPMGTPLTGLEEKMDRHQKGRSFPIREQWRSPPFIPPPFGILHMHFIHPSNLQPNRELELRCIAANEQTRSKSANCQPASLLSFAFHHRSHAQQFANCHLLSHV